MANIETDKIKSFVKDYLNEMSWAHTQKVVEIALILAKKEKADKEIVEIAAWFHDTGSQDKRAKTIRHHIYSAELAEKFLKENGLEQSKIEKISQCIIEHMGPYNSVFFNKLLSAEGLDWNFYKRPSTLEAKILYDADMVHLCSPFGAQKVIYLMAKQGATFKESIESTEILLKQALSDLQTASAKNLVMEYYSISEKFLKMIEI